MTEKFVFDGEEMEYDTDDVTEEYNPEQDIISLVDADSNEYEFEIIGELEYEDATFYALSPLFEDKERGIVPDESYMIFEVLIDENGEKKLAEVDNRELLEELEKEFDKLLNEDDVDEENEDYDVDDYGDDYDET